MSASWRLLSMERAKGAYFLVQRGRGRDREQLVLGYLEPGDAQRALAGIQREEDSGKIKRILRLFEDDRDAAIRYLVGDPGVEALVAASPDFESMTVREYFDQVYAAAREAARPAGWPSEQRHWKKLLQAIGSQRLAQVDAFTLQDHLDAMVVTRGKRSGMAASGTTKRLQRAALQAMMKHAYRHRHLDRLPDLAVFRLEGATRSVRKKPAPLSLDELVALLDAAGDLRLRALFAVGAAQGLRPSELVRLDWSDLDWNMPGMTIRGTKTEASEDTIPLTPLTVRELRPWWVSLGRPASGIMFPTASGAPYASPTGYKRALEQAARRAGIERGIYPYLLRDSFATIAWAVGMEKDVARRVLRHTDERMLDRVYCRPRPEDLVRAVASFDVRQSGS